MRTGIFSRLAVLLCFIAAGTLGCSPRDFLTRRLAADLISSSNDFRSPQVFWLKVGIVSNKDFNSPDSMVLQRRGWVTGSEQKCPPGVEPPPCWDVILSPLGVGIIRPLISSARAHDAPIGVQAARRELLEISGISKAGNLAEVEFVWRWVAMNQVGAAIYDSGVHFRSAVAFRSYDDGWRVVEQKIPSNQNLDEALRNALPVAPLDFVPHEQDQSPGDEI